MKIREAVFDRIEQTFELFKNNFVGLFLPLFLYNFIFVVIVGTITTYYTISLIGDILLTNGMDYFNFLNDSKVVMGIAIGMILFIIYISLYIVVFLGLLKSIKQAVNNENITIVSNIKYGFLRFYSSMRTYWYIFSYIALIPAILFIIGGGLFNLGYYLGNLDLAQKIGGGLMIVSLIIFLVFSIYRGIKATFALYSAVDQDTFDKNNFLSGIVITENNWWRIIGNFLLLGLLISLISGLIGGVFGLISFGAGGGTGLIEGIASSVVNKNPELIEVALDEYLGSFSIITEILSNIINNIIKTISSVFIITFTYLFYLRLFREYNFNESKAEDIITEEKNIEL